MYSAIKTGAEADVKTVGSKLVIVRGEETGWRIGDGGPIEGGSERAGEGEPTVR